MTTEYLKIMEEYNPVNSLPDSITPPAEQMVSMLVGHLHFLASTTARRNIRKGPSVTYGLAGEFTGVDRVYYYPDTKQSDWVYTTKVDGLISGWVSYDPAILLFLQLPNFKPSHSTPIILSLRVQVDVDDTHLGDLLKQNVLLSYEFLDNA